MGNYVCCICSKEFYAKHKTAICPECKETPSTCVICGKNFKRTHPYTQKTCSAICRGKYRSQSGVAKQGAAKMKQSKLERYGTLDPSAVAIAKNGRIAKRVCPLCNKEFQPETVRQIYCTDKHYAPCPVCGKMTEIKDYNAGVTSCSEECRMKKIYATNIERYGNKDAVNSEHAKILAKQTCLEKYGVEYYSQSQQAKDNFKKVIKDKYGVNAPIQFPGFREKAKQTNLEKYGTEWAMQSDEIKNKAKKTTEERYGGLGIQSPILRERLIATNRLRYGADFAFGNTDFQEKIRQLNIERYGVPNAGQSSEAIQKRDQTIINKYGCKNVFANKDIQEKIRQGWTEKYEGPNPMYSKELRELAQQRHNETMLRKYGAKYTVQVPELKKKLSETFQAKYGVPWFTMTQKCSEHNYSVVSKINRKFATLLESFYIATRFEHYIGKQSYDIHLLNMHILLEIDPTYTHNSFWNHWSDPKDRFYHQNKTKVAEEAGYRCIHIFDWDNWEAMIQLILPKQTIYARKCSVMQIDKNAAEIFTYKNHLQGSCRGQNIVYGLYYQGELVQLISFGVPRYNKNYDLELLRLCTRADLNVVGGASKLFCQFKKDYPDKSVISYCDYSKFTGKVYEQMGMKLDKITEPAKVWSKEDKHITDNLLRQRGYDQLFGTAYGKGTSNAQLMLDNGWLPVYDCGQKVFVYSKKIVI